MATTNNNVQYTLSLRDMLSSTLNRAQSNVQEFDKEVDRAVADIQRLNAALLQTGQASSSFMQTTGAVAVGTMLTRGIEAAGRAAVDQVKSILSAGLDASKLRAEFATLTGGKDMGNALFGDLTKYIQDSIFGTELYGSAKTLLSYGDSARQILPDLKMLGDIAMGDKEKMQSLVVAFGQVMSTGKLMGQDLNQMIQGAGFNPLMVIAERTKGDKSVEQRYAELKKLGEQGEISFAMIRQAFVDATSEGGRFYNMLNNIAETPFGKMQAMQGNIEAAKQQLGEALLPAVNDFMNASKPLIDELPKMFEALKPTIGGLIQDAASLAKWLGQNSDKVATFAKGVKMVAEAYAVYKVGTIAVTSANWLWAKSFDGVARAQALFTSSSTVANEAIALQTKLVQAEVEALTGLGAAQAVVAETSVAAGAKGAVGRVAAGGAATLGVLSEAVIPVAVMYFGAQAINALGDSIRERSQSDFDRKYERVLDPNDPKGFRFVERKQTTVVAGELKPQSPASDAIRTVLPIEKTFGTFKPQDKQSKEAQKVTTDPLKQDIAKVTGQQVKNIYVTINGGLIHDFTVKTVNLTESKSQIKRIVTEALTDSINDSQITD